MMNQRLDEWTDEHYDDYYNRQFKTPYRSTIKFCDWLEQIGVLTKESKCNLLDIGAGKGANIYYMKQRFSNCHYKGIDINNDFIQEGNTFFERENISNCKLEYGDLYNLDLEKDADRFEGIISYQTLSWLPEYENAFTQILKLNPDWIALTSLFYEGLIDAKIEIHSFENPQIKNSL
jgi:trans-aconitate methyltransferase